MLTAIRRASVAGEEVRRRPPSRLLLAIDVSEPLPVGVADDEAPPIQLGVGLVDRPRAVGSGGRGHEAR
jgi:hypothetical protein